MTPTHPLPNYLRSARKRAGLSQAELAFLLGHRGGKLVSRYETFHREPKLPMALAFEAVLGHPVRELFANQHRAAQARAVRRARVLEIQLRLQKLTPITEAKLRTLRRILDETGPEDGSNSISK